MLEPKHIRLIHTAKTKLCIDDDNYRSILQNFGGVATSKKLSYSGFQKVMHHFETLGFKHRLPGTGGRRNKNTQHATRNPQHDSYLRNLAKWQALGTRPGMASPAQLALIDTLWDELVWYWNSDGTGDRLKALHGFLSRTCRGVETMRFISFDEAGRVIEAMKAIVKRKGSRGRGFEVKEEQIKGGENHVR